MKFIRNFSGRSGACVLAAGLLLQAGCGKQAGHRPAAQPDLPAVQVRVRTVESKQEPATEEIVGTIRPRLRATLEAKITGRIRQMPVLLGQKVKAGELLVHLEAAEIQARLEQAEAALEQATRDWKRSSSLFEQQAATRSEYDTAESRQRAAKAAVDEAKAMMTYLDVLAPFEGVVTKKWVDVGDLALPGKPLVDLEDLSAIQLVADLPETIAGRVQAGARMAVRVDPATPALTGTVVEIAPAADSDSRTFRVKLDLPGNSAVRSGQFARLVVPVGESRSLRVPASAVVQRGQLEIVFVVDNQRAQLHLVKTGRNVEGEAEILSGLDSGDVVVTEGASLLADGQRVEAR